MKIEFPVEIKLKLTENGKRPTKANKGDWYDLYTENDIDLFRTEYKEISLGVSMELPRGYEAIVAPRSSTFSRYGIIMVNSIGIIDEGYCGNNDVWHFPAYCTKTITIPKHTRIAQFRIIRHQPITYFHIVKSLDNEDRGGFGSTGL